MEEVALAIPGKVLLCVDVLNKQVLFSEVGSVIVHDKEMSSVECDIRVNLRCKNL